MPTGLFNELYVDWNIKHISMSGHDFFLDVVVRYFGKVTLPVSSLVLSKQVEPVYKQEQDIHFPMIRH